jgi:hypothetical protein
MAFAGFELFTATLLFAGVLFAGVLAIGPAQAAEAGTAPDGLKMLKLFGDFRLRFESDWDSKRANGTEREDRSRLRIRARFGARIDPNPYVSFGVRLRTGSRESQQSPHFTISDFSGNATGPKSVVFDKWYAKVKYEGVSAWGGRNSFPFWKQNELFWDDDATPAGLAVRYNRPVGGGKLTVNGGYLALADGMELFNGYLGAGQLVYSAEVGGAKLTAAGGGFFFDGTSKRQARCVCMTRKLAEWPFENGQTENVGPSDGCRGNAVLLAAESKYDFRELGAYLGNVG